MTDREVDQVVKIQGTIFDRKRKVAPNAGKIMRQMRADGKKLREIAEVFGVSSNCVRYNLMTEAERKVLCKIHYLKYDKRHKPNYDDRIAYKRELLEVKETH